MKKGFTLVELLAVIVILAVILVIAVPQINSVIKQTKINGLASTAKIIAAKIEEATVENEILESNEALTCANLVKLDDNYGNCDVSMVNGKGTVTIVGANKFAGITCTGTKDNMVCTEGSSNTVEAIYASESISNPNEGYSDYTEVRNANNEQWLTFIKYPATGPYTNATPKSVCTLYGDTLTCLEATTSAQSTNVSKLQTLFGIDKCTDQGMGSDTYYFCQDGMWDCSIHGDNVGCNTPGRSCVVNTDGSVECYT